MNDPSGFFLRGKTELEKSAINSTRHAIAYGSRFWFLLSKHGIKFMNGWVELLCWN